MGFARNLGLSSPAMITILGSVSGSVCMGVGGLFLSSSTTPAGSSFLCMQTNIKRATAMRARSRANPINRYGNGEFKRQNSLEAVLSAVISSFSLFF